MDADFMASIPNALKGSVFRSQELAERLRSLPETEEQKQITDDIAAYIVEQGY